jgi:hypothetical protein
MITILDPPDIDIAGATQALKNLAPSASEEMIVKILKEISSL